MLCFSKSSSFDCKILSSLLLLLSATKMFTQQNSFILDEVNEVNEVVYDILVR